MAENGWKHGWAVSSLLREGPRGGGGGGRALEGGVQRGAMGGGSGGSVGGGVQVGRFGVVWGGGGGHGLPLPPLALPLG